MWIVYDASARATPDSPSPNDCLYLGPALQNKLWNVLIQQRTYANGLTGDIKKAFLQIWIHESERDALRFHWQTDSDSEVQTFQFTRVLLGGVLECHLDTWAEKYPEEVERLRRSFYVDDLLTGGQDVQQTKARKEASWKIMNDATFMLHKWHSNHAQLEDDTQTAQGEEVAQLLYIKTAPKPH